MSNTFPLHKKLSRVKKRVIVLLRLFLTLIDKSKIQKFRLMYLFFDNFKDIHKYEVCIFFLLALLPSFFDSKDSHAGIENYFPDEKINIHLLLNRILLQQQFRYVLFDIVTERP